MRSTLEDAETVVDSPRIGFYLHYPFHAAMLRPVYELAKGHAACLLSQDREALVRFAPHVLVVADGGVCGVFRDDLPGTSIVFVRHGFASKHLQPTYVRDPDFVCVSSAWVRDDFLERGLRPRFGFWVTGFPPLDRILDPSSEPIPPLPAELVEGEPTLLYAPTHNPLLNSVETLGSDWVDELRRELPKLNIIIKPHPVLAERDPELVVRWHEMARRNDRIHLVHGHDDIYPLLPHADVLLTDASSVMFFFLAVDRPVVLVTNPRRFDDTASFDPDGEEWTWRDLATEVETASDLPAAVRHALEHPDEQAEKRAEYASLLFGDLADGGASQRIADRVTALAASRASAGAPRTDPPEPVRRDPATEEWIAACWGAQDTIAGLEADARSRRESQTALEARISVLERELEEAHGAASDQAAQLEDATMQFEEMRRSLPVRASTWFERFPRLKSGLRRLTRRPGA